MPEHKESDRHRPIKDGYPDTDTEHGYDDDGRLRIYEEGRDGAWITSNLAIPNKTWL